MGQTYLLCERLIFVIVVHGIDEYLPQALWQRLGIVVGHCWFCGIEKKCDRS